MRRLTRPLLIFLALVFLFEAWLWEHLGPIVRWVVDHVFWRALRARVAAFIQRLPPYPTLLVFLVPVVILFPIKLAGYWLLAQGSWLGAAATLALAKLVSMGVTAFIFDLTRPKLLQLPWFRWIYEHVLAGLAWAHALADPYKRRIKIWFKVFAPKRAGRTFRLLARIRRRMAEQV
jgi:hypothetical protein